MNFSHSDIQIIPILETLQILDISDDEYFGDKYKDYISNSRLKYINPEEGGSPELFEAGIPSSVSDAFYFGSAVHTTVLQPEEFIVIDTVDRPTAKAGFMADELYKCWVDRKEVSFSDVVKASDKIDYYKGKMNDDKYNTLLTKILPYLQQRWEFEKTYKDTKSPVYLDPKSRDKVHSCLRNIANDAQIQKLLHPVGLFEDPISKNEATILLDVKCISPSKDVITLKLKAKIDNYTVDSESCTITLNDLKTTGHNIADFGSNSFYKFRYFRQMALYGWMLYLANEAIFKLPGIKFNCNMLLVSSIPPCNCGVFKVTNRPIQKGVAEFSDLLKRVAYYRMYGK